MADLVNPFANPYLPSFVNQRPRLNDATKLTMPQTYSQIHYVKGFEGADSYVSGLSNGSSEIITEENPNMARIYVTAKDASGQVFVQGFDLTPVERPKPVTMDDLSAKMNELLDRMNKLEEDKANAKPNYGAVNKGPRQPGNQQSQPAVRNVQSSSESAVNAQPNE